MKYIFAILFCLLSMTASAHNLKVLQWSNSGNSSVVVKFENCTKLLSIDQFGNALLDVVCPTPPVTIGGQDLSPPNLASPTNWSYTASFPSPFTKSNGDNGAVIMDENCRPVYYSDELNASSIDCRKFKTSP